MADQEGEGKTLEISSVSLEGIFPEGAACQNCVDGEYAIAYCQECKRLLCEDCLTYHGRQVDTRQHQVVNSPRAAELVNMYCCTEHQDKTLDYFCKDCKTPVCRNCMVSVCKLHSVMLSTDVRKDMHELLDRVKEKRMQFCHHAELIESTLAQNTDAFFQCEGEVRQAYEDLLRVLEEKKNHILVKLKDETEKNKTKVEQQKEFIQQAISGMDKTIKSAEDLLKTKRDAKLMINKVSVDGDLMGRTQHDWNPQKATFRCWQLEHKDQQDYATKFASLIPKPRREDIDVKNLGIPRVGVKNTFTITTAIKDQFDLYDSSATVANFLSVKILFTPTDEDSSTAILSTTTREEDVWTVSYFLRQHGTVKISISVCGAEVGEHALNTDPSRKEIQVGDRVVRGPDWKWDNQDGGKGGKGTVVEIKRRGWVIITWDKKRSVKHDYRWGDQESYSYDLEVVPE